MPLTIDHLIAEIKKNDPSTDTDLVVLAYEFANTAHAGQRRKSGEPYIQHALATAITLARIHADTTVIIAGLLHDVPEDTERTLADVEANFGTEVKTLVEGITKVGTIKYRGVERYAENLKKMFIAMAADLRVIIIKFADRLHNLQTLDALPPAKQQRIARETVDIYVPIAALLGMWYFKHRLEDLCFQYLYTEEYKKLQYRYEIEKLYENRQFIEKTKRTLVPHLQREDINFEIDGRFKSLYSIFKKMQRKDRKFSEIYDVFALRITVDEIADCYRVIGIIHSLWKPKTNRFKDYIAVPKPNGYRALHTTVFGPGGKITEFQVLTRKMYEESLYGIAAHWFYKNRQGRGQPQLERQPKWISDILEMVRKGDSHTEFLSDVKLGVFQNRIFVFTPKGDVIDLPEGATPVDFAYAVHTEIGNQCVGVMINDTIGKLDQELKSGDLVEILTDSRRARPGRDWLKFAKTQRARDKIKIALKDQRGGFSRFIRWK